jgi:hypothetical protein
VGTGDFFQHGITERIKQRLFTKPDLSDCPSYDAYVHPLTTKSRCLNLIIDMLILLAIHENRNCTRKSKLRSQSIMEMMNNMTTTKIMPPPK